MCWLAKARQQLLDLMSLTECPNVKYIIAVSPTTNFPLASMIRFLFSRHSITFVFNEIPLLFTLMPNSHSQHNLASISRGNSATAVCDVINEFKRDNNIQINESEIERTSKSIR